MRSILGFLDVLGSEDIPKFGVPKFGVPFWGLGFRDFVRVGEHSGAQRR